MINTVLILILGNNYLLTLWWLYFLQHLKTLKHPGIIKLLGVDQTQEEIWLITEHVAPLESVLESLSVDEICAGIYDIIQVMIFIHDKVNPLFYSTCSYSTTSNTIASCVCGDVIFCMVSN